MPSKRSQIILGQARSLLVWLVLGALAGLWVWRLNLFPATQGEALQQMQANTRALAGAVSQIAATMVGFTFAVMAILLSLSDRDFSKRMAISGHFQVLIVRMLSSALVCMVATVFSAAVIAVPVVTTTWLALVAGAAAAGLASVLDVLFKFSMALFFIAPLPETGDSAQQVGVERLYFDED